MYIPLWNVCTFSGRCHHTVIFSETLLLARMWCIVFCCVRLKFNFASWQRSCGTVEKQWSLYRNGWLHLDLLLLALPKTHHCCLYAYTCYPRMTRDHWALGIIIIIKSLLSSYACFWPVYSISPLSARGKDVRRGRWVDKWHVSSCYRWCFWAGLFLTKPRPLTSS